VEGRGNLAEKAVVRLRVTIQSGIQGTLGSSKEIQRLVPPTQGSLVA
jgi:hypothetical protein